ncbi:hypothetical protein ABFA07_009488 [Porites harrisoni]
MDVLKTAITVFVILFPVLMKAQQNLQEYSNYINKKKNKINKKQEGARKLLVEFAREIEASCQELTCNFDVSMCGFKQAKDDKFDWTRYRRNTSSSGKGPFSDHTTGNMTGEL